MLKHFGLLVATITVAPVVSNFRLAAQEVATVKLPGDTKVVAHIDVAGLRNTPVGKVLIEKSAERILGEVSKSAGVSEPSPEDVTKIIGINPVEDLRFIVIAATDLDRRNGNFVALLGIQKTLGGVVDLISTQPDYATETIGGYDFHSMSMQGSEAVEGDRKLHLAFYKDAQGFLTAIVGPNQDAVKTQLAKLDSAFTHATSSETFEFKPTPGALVDISVLELPSTEELGESPLSLFTHLLTSLAATFKDDGQKVDLSIQLNTTDQEAAEQLSLVLPGFAQAFEEQLAAISEEGLKVATDGKTVTVSVAGDSTKTAEWVNQQFDIAVGIIESSLGGQ